MVLGLLMMSAMVPATVPSVVNLTDSKSSSIENGAKQQDVDQTTPCHLMAFCASGQGALYHRQQVHNSMAYVGEDGYIYITKHPKADMTLFKGGLFSHPSYGKGNTSGYVAVSAETPPALRWVFLDSNTYEMRLGSKEDSEGHVCGKFSWTEGKECISLQGQEQWLAVQLPGRGKLSDEIEENRPWKLYCNYGNSDMALPVGAQALKIRLERVSASSGDAVASS